MEKSKTIFNWAVFVLLVVAFSIGLVSKSLASQTDGTIDSVYKYAWSQNIGFINFGTSGGNVHVTNNQLTGYAYSESYGWINLQPPGSGVTNNINGTLGGSAWGESVSYIDFTGVTIDSSGYFHGYANSTITGQISFNCLNTNSCASSDFKVRTDWRPQTATGGGGGGTPAIDPSVTINDGAISTDNFAVKLTLSATNFDLSQMMISNATDFSGALWEPYQNTKQWELLQGDGTKTVYVKYRDTAGNVSPTALDSIEIISDKSISEKKEICYKYITHYMRPGMQNDLNEVKKLQQFLRLYAGFKNVKETKVYDKTTFEAVKKLQEQYSLEVLTPWNFSKGTGWTDISTTRKINQIYCKIVYGITLNFKPLGELFGRNLYQGNRQADVKRLQKFLNSHGFLVATKGPNSFGNETGYFDISTKEALNRFQQANSLSLNLKNMGIFDEKTRSFINLINSEE